MTALQDVIDELQDTIRRVSPQRRESLLTRFTDQFLAVEEVLAEEHVQIYDEVIYNLACDIEFRARAQLAHRIAELEKGPYKTIRDLAFDDNHEVAAPIIELSPRLKEADLVAIARQKGQDHLMALSKRRNLTEMVTDILVRRGERPVQRSVAGNPTARFSKNTMQTLVGIADEDGDMRLALAKRNDIPKVLMERIVAKARAAAVRHIAEEVGPGGESVAEALVNKGIASIEQDGSTFSLMGDLGASEQKVLEWSRRKKLGEADVIELLNKGQLDDAAAMLAYLAMLPVGHVVSVLSAARIDPLLVVLKLAHFDWEGVQAIITIKVGGTVPPSMLKNARKLYDELSASTAERALRFIALRKGAAWG